MRIAIDAMGGDKAPESNIKGVSEALKKHKDIHLILVGKNDIIRKNIKKHKINEEKVNIVDAPDIITMDEAPTKALRKKKSSIVVGSNLIKNQKADAFISAGNTGAVMASGIFNIGRLSGIKRPAIATVFPSKKGNTLVLDAGANADCKPENLLQFSIMGQIYAEQLLGKKNPKIGLLSIGSEKEKGNQLILDTYGLINNDFRIKNFLGNVEGRDIFNGSCDVVITDGFTGNVVLKTSEGALLYIMDLLKEALTTNILTKAGALLIKPYLKKLKNKIDYRQYGGAPLLGLKGAVIISHGSSDSTAIASAISVARKTVKNKMVNHIEEIINREGEKDSEG